MAAWITISSPTTSTSTSKNKPTKKKRRKKQQPKNCWQKRIAFLHQWIYYKTERNKCMYRIIKWEPGRRFTTFIYLCMYVSCRSSVAGWLHVINPFVFACHSVTVRGDNEKKRIVSKLSTILWPETLILTVLAGWQGKWCSLFRFRIEFFWKQFRSFQF